MKKNLLMLVWLVLLVTPAFAGVVFEVETKDHESSTGPEVTHAYAEGKNLKMEIAPSQGQSGAEDEVIYRGDRRQMIVVDSKNKTYMVLDAESARQIGAQTGGMADQLAIAREQLNERLSNMTDEQRRHLEQALGNPKGGAGGIFGSPRAASLEVRNTGERAEKNGYPCVRYDVLRGGEKIRELWVTDWNRIEGGKEAETAFKDMGKFFEEMMDSGFPGAGFEEFATFSQIDGFPVVTRSFEGGSLEDETTLRSASRRTLDPADFEPPAGYKRRSMFSP